MRLDGRTEPAKEWIAAGESIAVPMDVHRAEFASVGIVANFAAERVSQQLVSVANAQDRYSRFDRVTQPLRGAFAPCVMFCHHRVGTADDDALNGFRRWQRLAFLHIDDARRRVWKP